MIIKPISELDNKFEIQEQIEYQTRIFNIKDYLGDVYAHYAVNNGISNNRFNNERAAIIKITRKNRYNIIVYGEHLSTQYASNYVIYDEDKKEYDLDDLQDFNKFEQASLQYLKTDFEKDTVFVQMYENKVDIFLPKGERSPFQKSEIESFAKELANELNQRYKKIEVLVAEYFYDEKGEIVQNDLKDYDDYLPNHEDFLKFINGIPTNVVLKKLDEADLAYRNFDSTKNSDLAVENSQK